MDKTGKCNGFWRFLYGILLFRSPCIYGKNRVSFSIREPARAGFKTAGAARLPADSGV